MYQVKFTTAYKKAYKLMKKRGLDISLLDEVVDLLRQGRQLEERCRDHGLTGDLAGFRECHIKPDWLLIYLIEFVKTSAISFPYRFDDAIERQLALGFQSSIALLSEL